MDAVGQIANWVGIASFALSIPIGIAAGLLTPKVSSWWASRSESRKARRIARLQAELQKLAGARQETERRRAFPEDSPLPELRCMALGPDLRFVSIPNARIFTLLAQNVEMRYESTVHHLRVELLFTPFRGEPVRVRPGTFAIEIPDDDGKQHLYFTALTSVGMGSYVQVAFLALVGPKFYTIKYDLNNPTLEHELPLGAWRVEVTLSADNAKAIAKYKLDLGPNGSYGITPIVDFAEVRERVLVRPKG